MAEGTMPAGVTHLVYSSDDEPGITRQRCGRGFVYRWPDGSTVREPDVLARIRALAVPPAYVDVWICRDPGGHLQATGFDARGRKQYRYHPQWREVRDVAKYGRLVAFGDALPRLRRRVRADLAHPGFPRERVLAMVVRLLELTLIRVGNVEYARVNHSYGLTTLLCRHVEATRQRLRFRFKAKGGVARELTVTDVRLCRLVKRCQELPGQALFQYLDDDGTRTPVTSSDVNAYLHEVTGADFTAKDFRTWAATVMAHAALSQTPVPDSDRARRRAITAVMREVARYLGNTPTVCRTSYVHPGVVDAWQRGELEPPPRRPTWRQAESRALAFLRRLRRRARAR